MTTQNYIKLLLFLSVLWLSACRKQTAPSFDNRRSRALLDASEAIADHRTKDATRALQKIEAITGSDDFCVEAMLAVRRQQQVSIISNYLRTKNYDELRSYLNSQEITGDAGTELLLLDNLPEALKALGQFCAKRPYRTSSELQKALEMLAPYSRTLSQTHCFQEFYAQQQQNYLTLKAQERQQRIDFDLNQMELAALQEHTAHFQEYRSKLKAEQSDHPYFQYEKAIRKHTISMPPHNEERLFIIAFLQEYPHLSPISRNRSAVIFQRLSPSEALSWEVLNALTTASAEHFVSLFLKFQEKGLRIAPWILATYLERLPLEKLYFNAWCWKTPVPGITETVSYIQQIKQIQPESVK